MDFCTSLSDKLSNIQKRFLRHDNSTDIYEIDKCIKAYPNFYNAAKVSTTGSIPAKRYNNSVDER